MEWIKELCRTIEEFVDCGGRACCNPAGWLGSERHLCTHELSFSRRSALAGITAVAGGLALGRSGLGSLAQQAGKPDDL